MSIKNSYSSREYKSNLLFHLMTFHRNWYVFILSPKIQFVFVSTKQRNSSRNIYVSVSNGCLFNCTSNSGDESNQFAKFVDLFQLRVNIIHSDTVYRKVEASPDAWWEYVCVGEWESKTGGETFKLRMVDFDMRQSHVFDKILHGCWFQWHLALATLCISCSLVRSLSEIFLRLYFFRWLTK